jgi:hypothetical protein
MCKNYIREYVFGIPYAGIAQLVHRVSMRILVLEHTVLPFFHYEEGIKHA